MGVLKNIINYCPYTIAGRKLFGKKTEEQASENRTKIADDRENQLMKGIKTGRNISLIGLFCPLFWSALIMGASGSVLLLHAVHSSLFIILGAIYAITQSRALHKYRLEKAG